MGPKTLMCLCHTHQRYIVRVKSFMLMCASENVPNTQTQCYTFSCCASARPGHSSQRPEVFPFTSISFTIPITHPKYSTDSILMTLYLIHIV